jgi:aminopeptidase N
MARDAELRTRDFLDLVTSGAPSISEMTVLGRLLRSIGLAVRRYSAPAHRDAAIAQLEDAVRGWLLAATPGSDHQVAWAKALADVATSTASLDLLASLLDGTESIDGLAVDTDLRWEILHRLVSRGAAGVGEIESELDRDRTDAGERHAESCLAAIPAPEAKAAAWAKITGGTLPNATFRAVLRGFRDPDQDELLAPYADNFYYALGEMWQDGASDMAQFFTEVGYPDAVSQATIDATDAYIAAADPVPALRRLLLERRDDVARALRCQQRDARSS